DLPIENALNVFVVGLGEETNVESLKIVQSLRQQDFSAEREFLNRKAKAQFKMVDKLKAELVITIGATELETQKVSVKNAETRVEKEFSLTEIYSNFDAIYQELMEMDNG
ncbi:MAG: histidine--tRNA ligase, partial [Streptococcaceae bacterium]|nr:histidine--tRNA ligase [Streptococcaceae bacterium]